MKWSNEYLCTIAQHVWNFGFDWHKFKSRFLVVLSICKKKFICWRSNSLKDSIRPNYFFSLRYTTDKKSRWNCLMSHACVLMWCHRADVIQTYISRISLLKRLALWEATNIHAYIIEHYNPSVRITTQLLSTIHTRCDQKTTVISQIAWVTYVRFSNFFSAILVHICLLYIYINNISHFG